MASHKQIENSLFSNSRSYDPLEQPDILRVRIADGAILADNRREWYGRFYVASAEAGTREFWAQRRMVSA